MVWTEGKRNVFCENVVAFPGVSVGPERIRGFHEGFYGSLGF